MPEHTIKTLFNLPNAYPNDKEVGVEVEMEGAVPAFVGNGWTATNDGSLRQGVEYVLNDPQPRLHAKTAVGMLYGVLKEYPLSPSKRCGVHIHLNFCDSTLNELFNFLVLFYVCEKPLVRWCGEIRESNLFCLRSSDAQAMLTGILHGKENGNLRNVMNDHYRYSALNLASVCKFGSVEARSLPTEKTPERILLWIDMLCALKDEAHKHKEAKHIIEALSGEGYERFFQRVFGKACWSELNNVKDLNKLLQEGVWAAQDIAYAPFQVMKPRKLPGYVDWRQQVAAPIDPLQALWAQVRGDQDNLFVQEEQ